MKTLLTSILFAIISISVSAAQVVCLQPSDHYVAQAGCVSTIQPLTDADPVVNVAKQAQLPGNVILWIGNKNDPGVIERFPVMIAEAKKYPGKFTHVYLIDELFLCDTGICMGYLEDIVAAGAELAHQAGLKTICTIIPDVILDPRFSLKNVNMCDGISIDVYPSIRPTTPSLGGCTSGINYLGDLAYCSAMKLRGMGFVGDFGYIYQAFGLHSDTEQGLTAKFMDQRPVIAAAEAFGAFVMPFGVYLGAPELSREPDLFQCAGTFCENLVQP